MNKKILFLLLLGFIFRIAISFNTYSGDVTNHMVWGQDAVKNGLAGMYDRNFEKLYGHTSPNYPSLIIFIFAFLYLLKGWVYQFAWFLNLHLPFFPSKIIFLLKDFNYYPYLSKLPAILSDIGVAYLTYLFAKKIVGNKKSNWPIISSTLVLFNPAYFYNSAYWGQTDSLPLFFLLTSFYILIYKKKIFVSSVLFTLGILSKQTTIIFLPLFLILLYNFSSLKTLIKTYFASLIIFWLFFLPFYKQGSILIYPFLTFWNKILLVSGLPFTSNHAFNFWYLLTGSRTTLASSKFILNVSYEMWGYSIFVLISVLILIKLIKSRLIPNNIYYGGYLIGLTSFLILTKMHERHLILTLPFLLFLTYKNKFLLITYIFISLFNFLNMYHNWWSPNIRFLMSSLSSTVLVNFLTIILIGVFTLSLGNYLFMKSE